MKIRLVTSFLCAAMLCVLAAPSASAQVPPVPPEVTEAIKQADATVGPLLLEIAKAAQPGVNAGGFALRPACVQGSTIALALGLAGLPLDMRIVTRPFSAFCKGALKGGPADPAFYTVDDAVGPQVQAGVEPALVAVNPVIEQVRPDIALVCTGLSLANPGGLPPPLSRFSVTNEICWR